MVRTWKGTAFRLAVVVWFCWGCADGEVPPAGFETNPTLGTAAVSLELSKDLGFALEKVILSVTGDEMEPISRELLQPDGTNTWLVEIPSGDRRQFALEAYDPADQLAYSGAIRAEIPAAGLVPVDIVLAPLNKGAQCLSLVYVGEGEGASERFVLEAGVSYVVQARYSRAITVDLVDAVNGAGVARLLQEVGEGDGISTVARVFSVPGRLEFFLIVRDTDGVWRVEVQGGY
jgi:hypothetical protein